MRLVMIGDTLYFRHEDAYGNDSHYDRFISDADLFYCSEHDTYFNILAKPKAQDEYVSEYGLWWSYDDQMYVTYLTSY
ncbi:MAG: hypothetical protein HY619_07410 [Thaumarchaeota archaeon]|nr:hypothetical protein [Nitrososphaerota archaeon]